MFWERTRGLEYIFHEEPVDRDEFVYTGERRWWSSWLPSCLGNQQYPVYKKKEKKAIEHLQRKGRDTGSLRQRAPSVGAPSPIMPKREVNKIKIQMFEFQRDVLADVRKRSEQNELFSEIYNEYNRLYDFSNIGDSKKVAECFHRAFVAGKKGSDERQPLITEEKESAQVDTPESQGWVRFHENTYGRIDYRSADVKSLSADVLGRFEDALAKGTIPSLETGDSGVKRKAHGWEIKVRRTILTANREDSDLRLGHQNPPTRQGRLTFYVFDSLFNAHQHQN